jgi:selenocysteine lyase/cysteine desulfurase
VDYRDSYQPGARRFDMGQRTSFQLVPMAIAALEQILAWRPERIAATLRQRTAQIAAAAADAGFDGSPASARGPHMLGLPLAGKDPKRLAAALDDAGVVAGLRGSALRISPHLHVGDGDVDRLVDALATIS